PRQSNAPAHYIRKQTLVNGERYITPELKEYEEKFLTAQDKILTIERRILDSVEKEILAQVPRLHEICHQLATVDCLFAFSKLALWPNYIFPEINTSTILDI